MKTVRRFWLSFVDPDRSPGSRFLGVVVIEVDEEDVERLQRQMTQPYRPRSEWQAAAIRKANELGVNPGGIVQIAEQSIDLRVPLNRLLSLFDLKELGMV